jgi:hypothetical protein
MAVGVGVAVTLDAVAVVDGEPEAADVAPEPELGATEDEADGATQAARLSSASAVKASRVPLRSPVGIRSSPTLSFMRTP